MATKQIDGVTDVTSTSTVNNGGVGMNVGTSSILTNRSLSLPGEKTVFASTVIDNSQVNEAVSAGVLAFENQRGVIRRVTNSLSDVSNDILVAGAAVPEQRQSINQTSGTYVTDLTTAIRDGRWNPYSGEFSPVLSGVDVDFGVDNAANPTRAVPGELYYLQGGKLPVTGTYSAKNT